MSEPDPTGQKQGGRFLPGQSGNPKGRPKGSRGKLAEAFIADLCSDWGQNGVNAIVKVREENPAAYLKVVASLVPREIRIDANPFDDMSDEELKAAIEVLRQSEEVRGLLGEIDAETTQ